ncbi:GPI ethanolamine phosphate transferase 1 [Drosophila biarmipes]|uniref:GPI ethanolamine phosphate transferase 1 n=1 Tax=Drosophila biarmipes TaxID=125945 RepID=UPI0007E7BABE|nr:GPI ethanolamine phosphate transferase 1 [Drosophila biarmipes]
MKLALFQTFLWCFCSVLVNVSFLLYRRLTNRLVGKLKNLMEMWKAQVVLVHLLLTACLLRIYYQPGPLDQLEPQKTLPEMGVTAAADRLVVFLIEGLNAGTFFSPNLSRTSYMRDIILREGLVGISKTSVPTLTRSAEVALLAGFNEMPLLLSAEKFDSIFNRTLSSKGGTVLKISDLADLRVRLMNAACLRKLQNSTRLVMFVHLEDVGGASPIDTTYLKKLHNAQRNIRDAYELIESSFNDYRTAYLLTSAHGLSILGSHGGGSDEERDTPFFLWGAGINHTTKNASLSFEVASNVTLQLHKLDQIQLAPLMSALIGLPPPVNNLANLPVGYVKVSREYKRVAMHLNALQLLAQAKALIRRHEEGVLNNWLPTTKDLDLQRIAYYQNQMDRLIDMGLRNKAVQTSMLAIKVAQKSLKYYCGYYHIPLVVTTVLALLGWQFFLLLKLSRNSWNCKDKRRGFLTWSTVALGSLGLLLGEVVFLRWASFWTVMCLTVPFVIWILTLAELPLKGGWIFEPLKHLRWIVGPAAGIIVALHCSCPFSLFFIICVNIYNKRAWFNITAKFLAWLALVCLLSGFLWSQRGMQILMTTKYRVILQVISMLVVILRPLLLGENHTWKVWLSNAGILVIGGIGIYFREMGKPVPLYIMAVHWTYLIYALVSIPYGGSSCPLSRLQMIRFNLLTVHALLSDSYTSLFAQALIIEYQMGIEVHEESIIADEDDNVEIRLEGPLYPPRHLEMSYRFALSILLYFYVSMFGTGHWLSSFTYLANTARLFLPDSCSVPMPYLVLIHLLIPSVIILSSLQALSAFGRQEMRSIFYSVMLICNVVVLFFVVFVPHHLNWPSVHPSVITALLAELTVVLLLACDTAVAFFFRGTMNIRPPIPRRSFEETQLKGPTGNTATFTTSQV